MIYFLLQRCNGDSDRTAHILRRFNVRLREIGSCSPGGDSSGMKSEPKDIDRGAKDEINSGSGKSKGCVVERTWVI